MNYRLPNLEYKKLVYAFNNDEDVSKIEVFTTENTPVFIQKNDTIEIVENMELRDPLPKGILPNKTEFKKDLKIDHPESYINNFNHSVKNITTFKCQVGIISESAEFKNRVVIEDSTSTITIKCHNIKNFLEFNNCPNIIMPKNWNCRVKFYNSGTGKIGINNTHDTHIKNCQNITELKGTCNNLFINESNLLLNIRVEKETYVEFIEITPEIGKKAFFKQEFCFIQDTQITNPLNKLKTLLPHFDQFKIFAQENIIQELIKHNAIKEITNGITLKQIHELITHKGIDPETVKFLKNIIEIKNTLREKSSLLQIAMEKEKIPNQNT
jgi:hypothetical protein